MRSLNVYFLRKGQSNDACKAILRNAADVPFRAKASGWTVTMRDFETATLEAVWVAAGKVGNDDALSWLQLRMDATQPLNVDMSVPKDE